MGGTLETGQQPMFKDGERTKPFVRIRYEKHTFTVQRPTLRKGLEEAEEWFDRVAE